MSEPRSMMVRAVLVAALFQAGCQGGGAPREEVVSSDATLASLALSAGIMTPRFAPIFTSYQVVFPYATDAVTVTPTSSDAGARIAVAQDGGAPIAVQSGLGSPPLGLPAAGATSVVTVTVTAADGTTTRTYEMTWEVVAPPSSDASLTSLVLSAGALVPDFAADTSGYAATLPADAATFTVTATTADPYTRISLVQDGAIPWALGSGSASPELMAPAAGATSTIEIYVLANDESNLRIYVVVLGREPASPTAPSPADRPDGWAGVAPPPTPGGAGATPDHVYTVHTRSELVSALRLGGATPSATPKIIYVAGTIDLSADAADAPLGGWDYLDQAGYGATYPTYEDFRDAFAAGCTSTGVDAALEAARSAGHDRQKAVVSIDVGSNTSILGIGATAVIEHGQLSVKGVDNVVIRNVAVLDAYDYFPIWDTSELLFNSEYDNIHVEGATHVWVDHCELGDGARPDSTLPTYTIAGATKKWVTHDGALDVTNGANYVTVSYCLVHEHDKTHLVGSSDTRTSDSGLLKTTFHHNWYTGVRQRLPRVRYGQVHVYDNYYEGVSGYAIGVGVASRIYSEANYFESVPTPVNTSFSSDTNPGYCFDVGSVGIAGVNGTAEQVGWVPSAQYSYTATSAAEARAAVMAGAGVGKL